MTEETKPVEDTPRAKLMKEYRRVIINVGQLKFQLGLMEKDLSLNLEEAEKIHLELTALQESEDAKETETGEKVNE